MPYMGIDYGMGMSNIDHETGIRYGVISQYSILSAWADSSEPVYDDPICPDCEGYLVEYDKDKHGKYDSEGNDYACEVCHKSFLSDAVYPESSDYYLYDAEGYYAHTCLDTNVIVCKSPYYTFAQYCSPCVPGAGNLDSPMLEGVKCYAFGHDWFDEGGAPYPVYRVDE